MKTEYEAKLNNKEVRLFSSANINNDKVAEPRATASLLSMVCAVTEFGKKIVRLAGAPAGKITCFSEVTFQLESGDEKTSKKKRLDGIIQVVRGKKHWIGIVEVKVGDGKLDSEQISEYHKLAKQIGANAVITISNQSANQNGHPPIDLKQIHHNSLKKRPVVHFSWERLLSEAQMLSLNKNVSDTDQKWMLDEWIRFVEDESSRIVKPPELGAHWKEILTAGKNNSLSHSKKQLREVARLWRGYLKKEAMRLRAKLGVNVKLKLTNEEKKSSKTHIEHIVANALDDRTLSGIFRIPDAAGDVQVDLDLGSKSVRYILKVKAPTNKKWQQSTRVNWLVKQMRKLRDLPCDLKVSVEWSSRDLPTEAIANEVVKDFRVLLKKSNGTRMKNEVKPKYFLLTLTNKLASSRRRLGVDVLKGISDGLEDFYRNAVEKLDPYQPPAPRLISKEPKTDDGGKASTQIKADAKPAD